MSREGFSRASVSQRGDARLKSSRDEDTEASRKFWMNLGWLIVLIATIGGRVPIEELLTDAAVVSWAAAAVSAESFR